MIRNVIIIGSGPAGLTAAIYAARANLNPMLVEGLETGGQLMTTTEVENFPGFPNGVMGPELIENIRNQAKKFGTEFHSGNVTKVDLSKSPFSITFENGDVMKSKALIISTGASANYLGLESEKKLIGYGVSACATCDGFFFKGKKVLVIGGGDSAVEEAIFLKKFAKEVKLVHRRDSLRASKILQDRLFATEGVSVIWDSLVEEVLDVSKNKVSGAKLKNVKTGETFVESCDGFFLAIGHTPNTYLFKNQIELDSKGFIVTRKNPNRLTETSVAGVYACGDVQDPIYKQAISAAGTGCMAALDAEKFIESL
ncbi:MAG: thioredoxin-disulfide reductase [Spirochaetota bacterium]|nr:thioredoxin-disulfide reductase [Spirochaetota bacterium]